MDFPKDLDPEGPQLEAWEDFGLGCLGSTDFDLRVLEFGAKGLVWVCQILRHTSSRKDRPFLGLLTTDSMDISRKR